MTHKPVWIAAAAGPAAVVVGEVPVTLADYGVQVPRVPIVLAADGHGIIEL